MYMYYSCTAAQPYSSTQLYGCTAAQRPQNRPTVVCADRPTEVAPAGAPAGGGRRRCPGYPCGYGRTQVPAGAQYPAGTGYPPVPKVPL